MWGQSWSNLGDFMRPFSSKPRIDVTKAMQKQGWTPKIMFQKAEEFFISLGLDPMPEVKTCVVGLIEMNMPPQHPHIYFQS